MNPSRIYGLNACYAVEDFRKEKIVRAYFSQTVAGKFSDLMKYLASQKKVYRIVTPEEMEKVSQSQHHEGVCFVIDRDPIANVNDWIKKETENQSLVILENVGNPHNMGAIMRICAHFGIKTIAVNDGKVAQSGAAMRIAEGGGEFIEIIEFKNLKDFIEKLKKQKYKILATSSHKGENLYSYKIPKKYVLLFGEEAHGLSDNAIDWADVCLQIPGSGNVESLNVSTAISVILGEAFRQHHSGSD
jgi:TrmH RNA methyltransferase